MCFCTLFCSSLLSLSLSSLRPLSLLTLLRLFLLLLFLISSSSSFRFVFSSVVSLFFLIPYPNFYSYVEYKSPFPRRCSFISLTLVARILKSTIVIVARGGWFGSGFELETGSFVSGLQCDHKDRSPRKLLK